MIFWVYILRCSDGSYYTGHSKGDSLERRIIEHQTGFGADWTKRRRPVELMWSDWCSELDDALSMEKRIKGWTRAKKEALMAGDLAAIRELAKRKR